MAEMEMETDLRGRLVSLEHQSQNRENRLSVLEAWRTQRDIDSARHDERWKHTDDKIDAVASKVDRIAGYLEKIMWTIIIALIAGIMGFIIKGGFNI